MFIFKDFPYLVLLLILLSFPSISVVDEIKDSMNPSKKFQFGKGYRPSSPDIESEEETSESSQSMSEILQSENKFDKYREIETALVPEKEKISISNQEEIEDYLRRNHQEQPNKEISSNLENYRVGDSRKRKYEDFLSSSPREEAQVCRDKKKAKLLTKERK